MANCRRFGARTVAVLVLLLSAVLLAGCLAEEGEAPDLPDQITWNDVAAIVLDTNGCNSGACHKPNGPQDPSMQYASLIVNNSGTCASSSAMITQGDRMLSCLYLAMTPGEASFVMPTSSLNKETIGLWIDQGAPGP